MQEVSGVYTSPFLDTDDLKMALRARNSRNGPRPDNSIADSLSRFQLDRFHSLATNASPTPCTIPPSAMAI